MFKATFNDPAEAAPFFQYFDTLEEAQKWVSVKFDGAAYTVDGNTYTGEWENFDGETLTLTAEIVEE